jgi:molybdate transport system substrate-binding protein
MQRSTFLRYLAAACALPLAARPAAARGDVTVFAAASLQTALEAIARLYRERTGQGVRFSFAASSALARQIEHGAPAAVFASADEPWMDHLQARGLIVPETRASLLGNRLVLVVPAARATRVELRPGFDFAALLGADGRWVTGDPAAVPVGRYAQQALTALGVWPFAQTRLVRAENVRVALALVERGEAAAGVVYATDAQASTRVRVAGIFPADSHAPISYPFAVVARHDSPAARDFLRFVGSAEARAIWHAHGFSTR